MPRKTMGPGKPAARKRQMNRELVLRALTDRKFRRLLDEKPEAAIGKRLTDVARQEVRLVLSAVKAIEAQIGSLADNLLCANGPCGIA